MNKILAFALVLCAAFVEIAKAQTTFASITGTVFRFRRRCSAQRCDRRY